MLLKIIGFSKNFAGLSFVEGRFPKTVINSLIAGLGNLPSTNDNPAKFFEKPIIFNSTRYQNLLLEELDDNWEAIGGVYYTNFLKENIEKVNEKKWRLSHLALPFWIYKKWQKNYSYKLTCHSLETYFKKVSNISDYESFSIIASNDNDYSQIINRWLEFIKAETQLPSKRSFLSKLSNHHSHKTKILFTMDVEGFNEGPLFPPNINCSTAL